MQKQHTIFIPVAHGELDYRREIKKLALHKFGDSVKFSEKGLDMQSYFKRISTVGFAIFNFTMQEGLGNILFLVWNGAKIFLKEDSSVYKQFKAWELNIFTIENDLNENNLSNFLDPIAASKNRSILEDMFCETKVKEYWKPLFQ